jgi:hypothetical protein
MQAKKPIKNFKRLHNKIIKSVINTLKALLFHQINLLRNQMLSTVELRESLKEGDHTKFMIICSYRCPMNNL